MVCIWVLRIHQFSVNMVLLDDIPQLQCFTIHISSIMKLEYQIVVFYYKDADNE